MKRASANSATRATTQNKKSRNATASKPAQAPVKQRAKQKARQAAKQSAGQTPGQTAKKSTRRTIQQRTQQRTQRGSQPGTGQSAKPATENAAAKERLRLWIRMLRTTRAIEADLRERLRTEFASTLPRFDVMSALHRYDHGIKMSELSRLLMVSNGNVTGIVERLAEEGLLIREADPEDRRAARVKLTRKGIEEFEQQALQHQQWIDECLSGISADESVDIATLLTQATADMKKR